MEKTDLGQIASNMDSDRLADKAAPFINKEKVLGPDHKISIPDGARFRRQQSGNNNTRRYLIWTYKCT